MSEGCILYIRPRKKREESISKINIVMTKATTYLKYGMCLYILGIFFSTFQGEEIIVCTLLRNLQSVVAISSSYVLPYSLWNVWNVAPSSESTSSFSSGPRLDLVHDSVDVVRVSIKRAFLLLKGGNLAPDVLRFPIFFAVGNCLSSPPPARPSSACACSSSAACGRRWPWPPARRSCCHPRPSTCRTASDKKWTTSSQLGQLNR